MKYRRIALVNAVLFFCFWLAILYAGADHPPPPGFILLVLLALACAFVVYFRVPTYIKWHRGRKKGRILSVLLDGLIAGFCAGLIPVLTTALGIVSGGGSDIAPSAIGVLIWFAVLGGMGVLNALFIYSANAFVVNKFTRVGS